MKIDEILKLVVGIIIIGAIVWAIGHYGGSLY